MIIVIKDGIAKYYEQDFGKWNKVQKTSNITYVGNFRDYGKFEGVEVRLDLDRLRSGVLEEDLDKKNLCYVMVLSSSAAYIKFPNKEDEITFDFLLGEMLVFPENHMLMTVGEYIIKEIIE
jgi:hypothetical protein